MGGVSGDGGGGVGGGERYCTVFCCEADGWFGVGGHGAGLGGWEWEAWGREGGFALVRRGGHPTVRCFRSPEGQVLPREGLSKLPRQWMVGLAGELVKGGKFICSVFKVWTCPII